MIYATRGELNPAATLSLVLSGSKSQHEAVHCWAVQGVAALVAGFGSWILVRDPTSLASAGPWSVWHAMLAEVIYTTVLSFVVLNCVASRRNNPQDDGNQFFGLA